MLDPHQGGGAALTAVSRCPFPFPAGRPPGSDWAAASIFLRATADGPHRGAIGVTPRLNRRNKGRRAVLLGESVSVGAGDVNGADGPVPRQVHYRGLCIITPRPLPRRPSPDLRASSRARSTARSSSHPVYPRTIVSLRWTTRRRRRSAKAKNRSSTAGRRDLSARPLPQRLLAASADAFDQPSMSNTRSSPATGDWRRR